MSESEKRPTLWKLYGKRLYLIVARCCSTCAQEVASLAQAMHACDQADQAPHEVRDALVALLDRLFALCQPRCTPGGDDGIAFAYVDFGGNDCPWCKVNAALAEGQSK